MVRPKGGRNNVQGASPLQDCRPGLGGDRHGGLLGVPTAVGAPPEQVAGQEGPRRLAAVPRQEVLLVLVLVLVLREGGGGGLAGPVVLLRVVGLVPRAAAASVAQAEDPLHFEGDLGGVHRPDEVVLRPVRAPQAQREAGPRVQLSGQTQPPPRRVVVGLLVVAMLVGVLLKGRHRLQAPHPQLLLLIAAARHRELAQVLPLVKVGHRNRVLLKLGRSTGDVLKDSQENSVRYPGLHSRYPQHAQLFFLFAPHSVVHNMFAVRAQTNVHKVRRGSPAKLQEDPSLPELRYAGLGRYPLIRSLLLHISLQVYVQVCSGMSLCLCICDSRSPTSSKIGKRCKL